MNQPSKFRTRNWVEINDESKGRYDNKLIKILAILNKGKKQDNICSVKYTYFY